MSATRTTRQNPRMSCQIRQTGVFRSGGVSAMGWIWAPAVVGSLIGAGAIADRRRYRGLPVPPELTGRAKRDEVRLQRARMEHLQASIRYSPFTTAIARSARRRRWWLRTRHRPEPVFAGGSPDSSRVSPVGNTHTSSALQALQSVDRGRCMCRALPGGSNSDAAAEDRAGGRSPRPSRSRRCWSARRASGPTGRQRRGHPDSDEQPTNTQH